MKKTTVTTNQLAICMFIFNVGSATILGINTEIQQDSWIALILSAIIAYFMYLIYGRILALFPGKDFYEIAELLLGKIGGKIASLLLTWYCLHLAALVLRNFSEFTEIVLLTETPQTPILLLMILTVMYMGRSDMRVLCKWSVVIVVFVAFTTIATALGGLNQYNIENFLPILEHSPQKIALATFQLFSFPFAELVVFLALGSYFSNENNPRQVMVRALILSFIFIMLIIIRNIAMLGHKMLESTLFPSYVAVRLIQLGNLTRIEGSISNNFLMSGLVKITICIMAAAKGLSHLLGIKHHLMMITPVSLTAVALATTLFKNTGEMFTNLAYYPFYAFPFQFIIPVLVWVLGERYKKKNGLTASQPQTQQ